MTAQGRYNDYKRYCTELGFFREVVETTTTEDGVQSSRTMCYCNVEECGRVFVKRDKGGYSTMGSHVVKKHIDILREMIGETSKKKRKSQSTLDAPIYADKAAHNYSGWIDLIVNENYPIDSVESR